MLIDFLLKDGPAGAPTGFTQTLPMPPRVGEEVQWASLGRDGTETLTTGTVSGVQYSMGDDGEPPTALVELEYLVE